MVAKYKQLTASAQVNSKPGNLQTIFVSAASATPTMKVWDSLTASGNVLLDTFTPVAGQVYILPDGQYDTGLYVTIVGTVSCTIFYK